MTLAVRSEPGAHARADRTCALFPKLQLCTAYQELLFGRVLGDVQLGDEGQHLLRDRRRRQCAIVGPEVTAADHFVTTPSTVRLRRSPD